MMSKQYHTVTGFDTVRRMYLVKVCGFEFQIVVKTYGDQFMSTQNSINFTKNLISCLRYTKLGLPFLLQIMSRMKGQFSKVRHARHRQLPTGRLAASLLAVAFTLFLPLNAEAVTPSSFYQDEANGISITSDTRTGRTISSSIASGNVRIAEAPWGIANVNGFSVSNISRSCSNRCITFTLNWSGTGNPAAREYRILMDDWVTGGGGGARAFGTFRITANPTADSIIVRSVSGQATEAGGQSTMGVRLGAAPSGNVTVAVSVSDTSEASVSPNSLTFSSTNYHTDQTVTVTGVQDTVHDGTQTYNVVFNPASTADTGYNALANQLQSSTTTDDETAPTVTLQLSASSISENGGTADVTASFGATDAVSEVDTTITVAVVANTGTMPGDFSVTSNVVLNIAAGSRTSTGTVTITAVDNTAVAADKSVTVSGTVANTVGGISNPSSLTLTIRDEDGPAVTIDSPRVVEGNSGSVTLTFTVSLSPTSTQQVTVDYADAGTGSATSGDDYTAVTAGTLTFAAGETNKTVTVSVTGDTTDEPDETVVVELSNLTNAIFSGFATTITGTGTIDNDDGPTFSIDSPEVSEGNRGETTMTFTVTLNPASTSATTVNYADTGTGTATSGTDYTVIAGGTLTFAAGETSKTINVAVLGDTVSESAETVVIGLSNPNPSRTSILTSSGTGTINDDDRVQSSDSSLSSLVLSAGELSPVFSSSTLSYTATVGRSVERLTVTPTASTAVSGIRVNSQRVSSGSESGSIELSLGENQITVLVLAENLAYRVYQIVVTREMADRTPNEFSFAAQSDAGPGATVTSETITVAGLGEGESAEISVSGGTLIVDGREFSGTTVMNGQRVAVSVIASNVSGGTATATLTIGGFRVDFTVTTLGASSDASLSSLSLSPTVRLSPAFAGGTQSYTATVSGQMENVMVSASPSHPYATVAIAPADANASEAGHQVSLSDGMNLATVEVTAEDGTRKTYRIEIARMPTDQMPDAFSFATKNDVDPGSRVTSDAITISGLGDDVATAISVSGGTLAVDGREFRGLTVTNGQRVSVVVVASREFGGTTTATVTIGAVRGEFTATTRAASSDANLGSLSFSPATRMNPSFTSNTASYTARVSARLATVTVLTTPSHPGASVEIQPADASASAAGHQVNLSEGLNTATIVVTAENNRTRKTYTVAVTRIEQGAMETIEELDREITTEVSRVIVSNALDAISARIGSVVGDAPATAGSPGGGLLSILENFDKHGRDPSSTRSTLHQSLDGAHFVLSLSERNAGASAQVVDEESDMQSGGAAIWGAVNYRNMSGGKNSTVSWDGELFSVHVGTDSLLDSDLLVGLSVGVSRGTFDYSGSSRNTRGQLKTSMTSLYPYLGWTASDRLNLWITAGYGQGKIEYNDSEFGQFTSDTALTTAAFGSRYRLSDGEQRMPGDSTIVDLKTEAWGTRLTIKGNEARLEKSSIRTHGVRLAIEGSQERMLESGGTLTPFGELGIRWDGGEGNTGTGVEVRGGLKLLNPCQCLTVNVSTRYLVTHESGLKEWGASVSVRRDSLRGETGMSYGASLSHGKTDSEVESLWERSATGYADEEDRLVSRLEAEVGYGLYGADGIYTPYASLGLADNGSRDYAVGMRFSGEAVLSLGLVLSRLEKTGKSPDHRVMLTGQVDW